MSDAGPSRKRFRASMAFRLDPKAAVRTPDPTSAAMRALAAADPGLEEGQPPAPLLRDEIPSSPPRPTTAEENENDSALPQISVASTISLPAQSANTSVAPDAANTSRSALPNSSFLAPPGPAEQLHAAESSNLHFSLFDKMIPLSDENSILSDDSAYGSKILSPLDFQAQQARAMRGRYDDGEVSIETRGYTFKARSRLSRHYIQDVDPSMSDHEKLTQILIWCLTRRERHIQQKSDWAGSAPKELARVALGKLKARLQSRERSLDWAPRPKDEPLPPPVRGRLNTLNENTLQGFITYKKALVSENEQWPEVLASYENAMSVATIPTADDSTAQPDRHGQEAEEAQKELSKAVDRILAKEALLSKVSHASLAKDTALEVIDKCRERTVPPVDTLVLLKALTRQRQGEQ